MIMAGMKFRNAFAANKRVRGSGEFSAFVVMTILDFANKLQQKLAIVGAQEPIDEK